MKSENIEVSMSNIKSAIESWLRSVGKIHDSENVYLTFSTVADHTKVKDWEAMDTVPIQIHRHKEVKTLTFG